MTKRTAVLWTTTVLAGVAALLIAGGELTSQTAAKTPAEAMSPPAGARANADHSETAQDETISKTRVVAYYFHRTMRCPACLSIEGPSREAIEIGYADELKSGQLEWLAIDIETPGNEHFENDFELEFASLVLVEMVGEEIVRWKNLTRVWELVDDSLDFEQYVWTEVAEFLEM